MNALKLNAELSLAIESEGKRVRIVVYRNGVEEVCPKEYLTKLRRFIELDDERIFKGRLRLQKAGDSICVVMKGVLVGTISMKDFYLLINLPIAD